MTRVLAYVCCMKTATSAASSPRVGPYSRILTNGAAEGFDGRSREGRFLRRVEAELLAQISGEPTFAQTLLVRRICRLMLQSELLDAKLASGEGFTPHDGRTYSGIQNAARNALKDLGLKAAPRAKPLSLTDYAASKAAQRAGGLP